jgi:hypothetical protein
MPLSIACGHLSLFSNENGLAFLDCPNNVVGRHSCGRNVTGSNYFRYGAKDQVDKRLLDSLASVYES